MRMETLRNIAKQVSSLRERSKRVVLVGIDGADGSGKSFFARELSDALDGIGLKSAILSIDDFHNKKAVRYKKGKNSPLGFFEDSHNLEALVSDLLKPVKNGESIVLRKLFDCESDSEARCILKVSSLDVVIFEGLFLHRDELVEYWDYTVFLETDFTTSVARGNARYGLNPDPNHESNARYVIGNKIYRDRCDPKLKADIVVDNNELDSATIISNKYGFGTRSSPQP
jgi:uridine kinase